jgi:hypothetical protein
MDAWERALAVESAEVASMDGYVNVLGRYLKWRERQERRQRRLP